MIRIIHSLAIVAMIAAPTSASADDHGHAPGPRGPRDLTIPVGAEVLYDSYSDVPIGTLRVDGTLRFSTRVPTRLVVDTIRVGRTGRLVIGTADDPVIASAPAEVVFAGDGPVDPATDPTMLGRGLVSMGSVEIHGEAKIPYTALGLPAARSATTVVVAEPPLGWRVGDEVVIAGQVGRQYEYRIILAIDGYALELNEPLEYDHVPTPGFDLHVANLTRSVTFRSASANIPSRGHVMLMGTRPVDIRFAAFDTLGRTHKRSNVTDPAVGPDGVIVPGTADNPRGRYALHFHYYRHGDHESEPGMLVGNALVNSPGWGFVNHSSHVVMEDNVAVQVLGSCFVTEDGDELGSFRRNLAIGAYGYTDNVGGFSEKQRAHIHDFGHVGHGYWFQGTNVEVEGNIAANCRFSGFSYGTRSGILRPTIAAGALAVPELTAAYYGAMRKGMRTFHIPIRLFRDNSSYACHTGFWAMELISEAQPLRHVARNHVERFRAWNCLIGTSIEYTRNWTFADYAAIVTNPLPQRGVSRGFVNDTRVENATVLVRPTIRGYQVGLASSSSGFLVGGPVAFSNILDVAQGVAVAEVVVPVVSKPRVPTFKPSAPLEAARGYRGSITVDGTVGDSSGSYRVSVPYSMEDRELLSDARGPHYRIPMVLEDRITGRRVAHQLRIEIR